MAAANVARLSWPKLNSTLRAGFGAGVTAFTPTTTRFAHSATLTPKSTYAAIFTANATEIVLVRKSRTGLRCAIPASASRKTNITGSSDEAGLTESELRTKQTVPASTTVQMYRSANRVFLIVVLLVQRAPARPAATQWIERRVPHDVLLPDGFPRDAVPHDVVPCERV